MKKNVSPKIRNTHSTAPCSSPSFQSGEAGAPPLLTLMKVDLITLRCSAQKFIMRDSSHLNHSQEGWLVGTLERSYNPLTYEANISQPEALT
jgi:hypothetical protein